MTGKISSKKVIVNEPGIKKASHYSILEEKVRSGDAIVTMPIRLCAKWAQRVQLISYNLNHQPSCMMIATNQDEHDTAHSVTKLLRCNVKIKEWKNK